VGAIRPVDDKFEYSCEDGTQGTASKVLLASGIVDELPAIAGIDQLYGTSVHHCLYCDGFEYRGKAVAAYGVDDKGAELGLMMRHWIADIVVCSDGTEISEGLAQKLRDRKIPVRAEKITRLTCNVGSLSEVHFDSGPPLARDALFFATGCHPASNLSELLGCKRDEKAGVLNHPVAEDTSVRGSMSQAMGRATCSWSQLPLLRAQRQRSLSIKRSCGLTDYANNIWEITDA
jgi:thioredoxin reductase